MSSSITNDLTKWNDEQLRENEDNNDELFEKKSAEHRCCTKAWKEAERQMVNEVARRKAEEEAKQKVEVEAQRRTEAEAKVHTEEVAWAQNSVLGPPKGKQLKVVASRTVEVAESVGGIILCYECSDAGVACEMMAARGSRARSCNPEEAGGGHVAMGRKEEGTDKEEEDADDCEVEENCDALGTLVEVLSAVVGEMRNMATDRRHAAAESHAQMERMLGTLEEIRGCLDLEFTPEELEEGSEEDFEEEEVVEAAKEKEALKGRNEEEAEVDESV
ncbi:hypothetical protein PAXRUDRAFT_12028 [Paxillus rubicundulus Ve08.2h10]|uniref:Uncharacterized protein n=1 Tax=Paxillus rubicundulus Ve08.2h10 TaxID=930991 RepID=A0A0D0E806_9AGAM|nr:hypothetical protein PAXRUDRAFT_12028 [Paxillus rubicundulus Ve08.2h10]